MKKGNAASTPSLGVDEAARADEENLPRATARSKPSVTTMGALLRSLATSRRSEADALAKLADASDTEADPTPTAEGSRLLDRAGLGRALDKSPASIDRLVRDGLPFLWVGETKRFELDKCLAWLRRGDSTTPPQLRPAEQDVLVLLRDRTEKEIAELLEILIEHVSRRDIAGVDEVCP